MLAAAGLVFFVGYQAITKNQFFTSQYSQPENYYQLALVARSRCQQLDYLIPSTTRNDYATLESMGLLITTSKWWGNHPSVVYYFGKPVNFIYNIDKLAEKADCLAVDQQDIKIASDRYQLINKFGDLYLYQL